MRRSLLIAIWLLCMAAVVQAQSRTITGKVTDKAGTGLAGVSVTIKNSSTGTQTADNGDYSLTVPSNARILVFSFVGHAVEEVNIGRSNTLNVTLSTEEKKLDEVVVVAYGTQRKREVTSSIAIVDDKAIKRQQVTTVGQALQGTAAGVLVVNNSGQPGDNPQIRIRGIASLNANAEPLLVLDGIPFDGNLNMINPNDIENFSVLKDGTATALYGSRAAAGVILINTKRGRKGMAPSISAGASFGVASRALPEYNFVNSQQMFELGWEALRNLYVDNAVPNPAQQATDDLIGEIKYNPFGVPKPVGTDGKLIPGTNLLWNTDWSKELTRTNALRRDVNLSVAGGGDQSRYFCSAGYLTQEGYVITSKFNRISARFNYTNNLKDWLEIGARTAVVFSDQNYPDQAGGNFENVIQYIRTMSSIYPVYKRGENGEELLDAQGKPIYDFGSPDASRTVNVNRNSLQPSNLVATTLVNTESRKRYQTNLNTYADIRLAKGLKFRSSFGIDKYLFESLSYETPEFGNGQNVGGRARRQNDNTTSWTWNNMLSYNRSIGFHTIDVMASTEAYKYELKTLGGRKIAFPFAGLTEFSTAATTEALTSGTTTETLNSYLGRVKYDFKGKYFAELTVRWDGSSRFAPGNQWGFFPAGGVSWLLSEEEFVKNISFINFLKLRASYGEVGNNRLTSYFPYLSTFSGGYDNLNNPGIYLDQLANADVRWEKQGNLDIGVDFGIWKNRINGSIDYFRKSSIDLLFTKPLVFSGGIPSIDYNIGTVVNAGVEFTINARVLAKKNFEWNSIINASFVKNTIKKLPQEKVLSGPYQLEVGRSFYDFYIQEWAGVDPTNGKPQWFADELDNNGNPTGKKNIVNTYAEASRYYMGTAIPKVTGGWTNTLTFKSFDFSMLINFALGGKIYDGEYSNLMHGFTAGFGDQLHTDMLGRWQKAGDVTDVPRIDLNNTDINQRSSKYLYDGDYVRLRNITLGFTFNPDRQQKVIKSSRFYVQADNIGTWSKLKKGSDPETDVDGNSRPQSSVFKIISAGLELTF
ncbi:TonB-dependent receptor [Paraflavitalea sp. CAU 1676]|uniref:SusC/RagA family TonB-linked outer membrane protein n=1 Tax=Paraflavitalea sp. CAU 1676 TaxID=3032598 RepID=UPI0023DA8692|nr:TonB-dependent receptor [Paraflavitalea sp. CAU 1676]MDF2192262.1 TonB-dependent receptor [Paraflavitalea sp. CAU 1676]